MIFGERVEQAREYHGLTQTDFAARLRCDQSMIAKVESGIQPGATLARALADETGFPLSWFEQEPTSHFPLGSLQFRARASMTAKERRQAYQHAKTAYEFIDLLLPRVKTVPLRLHRLSGLELEDAAAAVRSECGLSPDSPIPNVFNAVERAGAIVIALSSALQKRDGFSAWAGAGEGRPIITIPAGATGDRMRWTTAHEVGELVLSSLPPGPDREKAADQFAAAFLLPPSAMMRELKMPISLTTLAKLKPRWGVSMWALARRAKDLRIISDRQYRYLMQQMASNHWRTTEPVSIALEKPRAVRKIVEVLYGDPINYRKLSSDTHLSPLYLRELLRMHASSADISARPSVTPDVASGARVLPFRR
jgi:Zn-dependent peptidase ImmA (M78 family)/transcriptional regulator with XRE-family HTH domain